MNAGNCTERAICRTETPGTGQRCNVGNPPGTAVASCITAAVGESSPDRMVLGARGAGRPAADPTRPKPTFDDPNHGQSVF